jgi:hypothetical protein
MPTQQRVRTGRRTTGSSAQQLPGRSEEDAVTLIQPRTRDLTAKHREFVAEHHDLELLELAGAQTQRRHRKHTPKQQVQQRHHQEATPSTRVKGGPTQGTETRLWSAWSHLMNLRTRHVELPPNRIEHTLGMLMLIREYVVPLPSLSGEEDLFLQGDLEQLAADLRRARRDFGLPS